MIAIAEKDKQRAWKTTERLFRNGQGQEASRLLLIKDRATGYIDLGGWCKSAVADMIGEALAQEREEAVKIVESFAHDVHMEMADANDIITAIRAGKLNEPNV